MNKTNFSLEVDFDSDKIEWANGLGGKRRVLSDREKKIAPTIAEAFSPLLQVSPVQFG
ncbi:hypothetical protein K9N68_15045 [Kovacikia minuta CCNUW1]|uniref:hypothetical protein n=1 Tax=Kovacikia minuta TaxID=2931930 RepID=UPI001CCCAB28|nr:hypothetical protein [Kovacikia minuta]UBF29034.1 hypothetical protein K9N68_15045 [Kovacikia minuta CCNUW1]